MTNFEKYFDELNREIELDFSLIDGKVAPCHGVNCNVCDFCDTEIACEVLKREWLLESTKPEYKYYVTYMTEETIEAVYSDRDKPLTTLEEVEKLKEELKAFAGYENVCILNWRELEV